MKWAVLLLLVNMGATWAAPASNRRKSLDILLERLLDQLYEEMTEVEALEELRKIQDEIMTSSSSAPDIYEQMQGDQPTNNISTDDDYFRNLRNNRGQEGDLDRFRTKEIWKKKIRENILMHTGHGNSTTLTDNPPTPLFKLPYVNFTLLQPQNDSDDDQITEKIRSYYPSCEVPETTDNDSTHPNANLMHLIFNFEPTNEKNSIVATATLRLYRTEENTTLTVPKPTECKNSTTTTSSTSSLSNEDEKLLRVSIYWYTLKKKKATRRRLADSKVVSDGASWVELSIKPATRQLARGKSVAIEITVEDQYDNVLVADKYFKGPTCTPLPSLSPPLSSMRHANPPNWSDFEAMVRRHPFLVIHSKRCRRQSTFAR